MRAGSLCRIKIGPIDLSLFNSPGGHMLFERLHHRVCAASMLLNLKEHLDQIRAAVSLCEKASQLILNLYLTRQVS